VVRISVVLLLLCLTLAAQNDPAILLIRIVEGEGAVYPIGSRATRGITIQVTDEAGKPVDSATVNFQLPNDGPGGTFSSGMRTEMVNTGADGRANAWGMQWSRATGPFDVHITVSKGEARAATVCRLTLENAVADAGPIRTRGSSHKKIWIGVGVATAAFVGVAAIAGHGASSTTTAAATVNAPQIGMPSIIIGRP
jgi:hypothetical protein